MAHSRFRYYLNYSSKPWTVAQGLQKTFFGGHNAVGSLRSGAELPTGVMVPTGGWGCQGV